MKKKALIALICCICFLLISFPQWVFADEPGAYLVIEANSGTILAEKNKDQQYAPAGLLKIMSFLTIFEAYEQGAVKRTDMITISENAAKKGGTSVFLDAGRTYTFEELLKAAVVSSGNDATVAIGEHLYGSEEAFTELINTRAKELGMQVSFQDVTGLSSSSRASAEDIAKAAIELSKHSAFFEYSDIWTYTFIHQGGRETELTNANKLIKSDGFDGMATGSSKEAGYCLAASLKNGNARYLCIILDAKNSDERFAFASEALNYYAQNYMLQEIAKKGSVIKTVPLVGANKKTVDLCAEEDLFVLLSKGKEQGLKKTIDVEELTAPIKKGEQVGEMTVTIGNSAEYHVPLIAKEEIEKVTIITYMHKILYDWLFL